VARTRRALAIDLGLALGFVGCANRTQAGLLAHDAGIAGR
jgi:hypothetical protein